MARLPLGGKLVTLAATLAILAVPTVMVCYAPTLYRIFCQATGFGGTTRRAARVEVRETNLPITVRMDTNVAPDLPWDFKAEKTFVQTRLGEPTLVFFDATNRSDETIVGHAAYNVTPQKAGPYFTKTECFCFTDEELKPGATARMVVQFVVDPKLAADDNTEEVGTITLSYTFFRTKPTGPVRDMAAASKAEAEKAAAEKASQQRLLPAAAGSRS